MRGRISLFIQLNNSESTVHWKFCHYPFFRQMITEKAVKQLLKGKVLQLFYAKIPRKGCEVVTDLQAKKIRDFRMKGIGYKAIASVLRLSRDVVRNYCKSHGLDGYALEVAVNLQEQIQLGSICLYCSQTIQQSNMGRKRKFCSEKCRREWWIAHPEDSQKKETAFYQKTCAYCGQQFTVYGNKNRRYCSHECYAHDRFWREEEGKEPYVSPTRYEEVNHE